MAEDFKLKQSAKEPEPVERKAARPEKPKGQVAPKIVMRRDQKAYHHLFKAEVTQCKKNLSYKKDQVMINEFDHSHYFHSIDSNGRPMTKTNACAGHFHYVEWGTDDEGNIVATCGPAIKEYTLQQGGRTFKKEKPLSWTGVNERGELVQIKDEHSHTMTYQGSEEIKPRARYAMPSDGTEASQATLKAAGVELK